MKKAGITIFSLIIMLVIILLTVRGCSFSKKTEQNSIQNNQSSVVLQGENNSSEKETSSDEEGEKVSSSTQNSPSNTENKGVEGSKKEDVGSSAENLENKNTFSVNKMEGSNNGGTSESKNPSIEKVDEPILKGSNEIEALVSGKNSYMLDGVSYVYSISIIFPKDGEYDIVNYFCPKKTYDAVSSGESIKLDYQMDEEGRVSINSISKK